MNVLEYTIRAKDNASKVMEAVGAKIAQTVQKIKDSQKVIDEMRRRWADAISSVRDYAAEADKRVKAQGGGYKSLADQLNEIREREKAATAEKRKQVDAIRAQVGATDDFSNALRRTSVNWDAIKEKEQSAKKRRMDMLLLQRELVKAEKEAASATGANAAAANEKIDLIKKGIANLKENTVSDFNAMQIGMNAMSGNIRGVATGVINLAAKFKLLGLSMKFMSVYTIAIFAIIKAFTAWKDKIDECNAKMRELMVDGMAKRMEQLAKAQKAVNDRMEEGNRIMQDSAKHMQTLTTASAERQKALNEQARENELAGAFGDRTGVDEARIKFKYDKANDEIDRNSRIENEQRELDSLRDQIEKTEEALSDQNKLVQMAREARAEAVWEMDHAFTEEDEKMAKEMLDKAQGQLTSAVEQHDKISQKLNDLNNAMTEKQADVGVNAEKDKLDILKRQREERELEREIAEKTSDADLANAAELEQIEMGWDDAWREYQKHNKSEVYKAAVQLMQEYYEAMASAEDDRKRDEIKAEYEVQNARLTFLKQLEAEEDEKRKAKKEKEKQAQKELHEQRKADAQAEYNLAKENLSRAQERARAAQDAVSQAWGWYKDPESLKARIADEEKNIEANKKYRKDYYSLTHGRWSDEFAEAKELQRLGHTDKLEERMAKWRKGSFGLSVEEEATMRVALAENEAQKANRDLARVAENTDVLKSIYDEISGEKEEA